MCAAVCAALVAVGGPLMAQAASGAPAGVQAGPQAGAVLPLPATPPDVDAPTYKPALTFDISSVRETERGRQIDMGIVNPSHKSEFSASTVSLHILIQLAYSFGPFQIVGGPDWMNDRYFTVQAKSDPSVDAELAKMSDDDGRLEKLHMVQAMLADRFGLRAHWETRQAPVFVMTIAKSGLKMQPTKLPVPEGDPSMAPTTPTTVVHAHGGPQGIEIDGERFSMRAIALMLSTQLHVPVIDKTGDQGYYDFAFQFARDTLGDTPADAYPSIPAAVEEELGLKLTSEKGPVDVMVIDHAEMPTAN
ncbi:MAG TPA: TIGR03435 family protein [Acidobacteriaceae bacterium]|nr:TIGR03435 family protein [Acidobacteriaceae bacterium]